MNFVRRRRLALLSSLCLMSACSSMHVRSGLDQGPLRVRPIGQIEVGEGVFEPGAPAQSMRAPTFLPGNEILLVTMGGSIEVRDLRSLGLHWKQSVRIGVDAKPLILGSSVIVATMDARILRLRLSNGEIEWSAKLPSESPGGMAASRGLIYVTTGDDSLVAIDERTGNSVWTYKRPSREGNVLWSLRGSAVPVLSLDGQSVFAGFSDGVFVGLEASSGKTLWERNFDRSGRFRDADTPPVLSTDGSVIYLALVDGDLLALRARDGSTLWSLPGAAATPPFVDATEKAAYLSTRDSKIVKISLEDNRIVWTSDLGKRGLGSQPVPVVKGFLAATTTHAGLVFVSRENGQLVWEDNYSLGTIAPPAFDGKRLAVMSSRNRLHVYSVEARDHAKN